MTVHKAKGLEFPVVIIADTTMPGARERASRYVDAERSLCAVEIAGMSPWDLLDHERKSSSAIAPKRCAWPTWRRHGRAISWSFPPSATIRAIPRRGGRRRCSRR